MNIPFRFRHSHHLFPALAAFVATVLPTSAATVTWTGGATGAGTTWNTSANWGGTAVGTGNDLVINNRNGAGDMPDQSVNADFTIRSLSFDDAAGRYPTGGLVVSNNVNRTLTLGTAGITALSVAADTEATLFRSSGTTFVVALPAGETTVDIGANSSLTMGGVAAGSGTTFGGNTAAFLTKTGAGTLHLGGSSTYGATGGLNILGGTVSMNASPAQLVANGGTVTINGGTMRVINATAQSGNGRPFRVGSSIGTIEVDAGKQFGLAALLSNVPTQAGVLRKTGAGILSMEMGASQQTITGGTIVEEGTLRIVAQLTYGGAGGLGVTVKDGGILQAGHASPASPTVIVGNSVFEQNSRLDLGQWANTNTPSWPGGAQTSTTGFIRFDGNLDISGAATSATPSFLWDLKTPTTSDRVTLASTFVLTIGSGVLGFPDFTFTAGDGFAVGTYTLFSASQTIVGTLASGGPQPIDSLFGTLQLSGDGKSIELLVSAVPEPSTYVLLGLGSLAGLMAWRRARRAQQG